MADDNKKKYIKYENTTYELMDGEARSKLTEVEKAVGKELNILVLGNSFSQDAFAYLPPVLNELLPGHNITYGVAYTASCGAIKHLEMYENDQNYDNFHLWRAGADHWSRYAGSGAAGYSLRKIMAAYDWDIVYMQSRGSIAADAMEQDMMDENITPGRELLRVLQEGINSHFVFLTGQWLSFIDQSTGDTLASYFRMRKAMKYVGDRLGVDGVIPVGAGIGFARMDAELDALGENGHMLYDSHQQAGLPALISTYVIAQYLLKMMGRAKSVYHSSFVPTAENVTAINCGRMTHGAPVGVTTENILKAQEIAVAAVEHPDSVYGETDPSEGVGSGITDEAKAALLACFQNVAWINDQGQTYYDALYAALYPPADVLSISAMFTQGSAVIYDTDSLDTLKQYLVVTATMTDSTTQTVTNYTLSGTLTVGTSTITVSYNGKTTTFNVTVEHNVLPSGYTKVNYLENTSTSAIKLPVRLGSSVKNKIKAKVYVDTDPSSGSGYGYTICGCGLAYAASDFATYYQLYLYHSSSIPGRISEAMFPAGTNSRLDLNGDYYGNIVELESVIQASTPKRTLSSGSDSVTTDYTTENAFNYDLNLFCNIINSYQDTRSSFIGRIYSFSLEKNDTKVLDLVPCYRNSDNKPGMYDTVSNTFLVNSGGGEFTWG